MMNILVFCFIVSISVNGLHSTDANELYDPMIFPRTFPFWHTPENWFQPKVTQQQFDLLYHRLSVLEAQTIALQASVTYCQGIISRLQPKCPAQATGAALVGSVCYSYEATAATYAVARAACIAKGGKLAEPAVTDDTFYARIKAAFPALAPATGNIIIGVTSSNTNYVYDSTGTVISLTSTRWATPPAVFTARNIGVLMPTGTGTNLWALTPVASTTPAPYLCQYTTVI